VAELQQFGHGVMLLDREKYPRLKTLALSDGDINY